MTFFSQSQNFSSQDFQDDQGDICEQKKYWKNVKSVLAVHCSRRKTLFDDESITHLFSYLKLASFKLNQQGDLTERKVWVKPKNLTRWFKKIFTQMEKILRTFLSKSQHIKFHS
nr:uncharacterized protein LOC124815182 [Hydra vulgaris]